jgi:hypothetical protein
MSSHTALKDHVMDSLHVLSLGAGVQSTAMLLMAMEGEIKPKPDLIVFADTQWEPAAVYDNLERLRKLGAEIEVVTAGDIRADALDPKKNFASIPLITVQPVTGDKGMLRRQCTREYKIAPIRRLIRQRLKQRQQNRAVMWMGITTDEALRMRESNVKYIENRYPLIDMGLSRRDCMTWLNKHGYEPPQRSACIGCPFRDAASWRDIKKMPDEWADVVDFDERLRSELGITERLGSGKQAFLHSSGTPLRDVDLRTLEDKGQLVFDGFGVECEGMCGV